MVIWLSPQFIFYCFLQAEYYNTAEREGQIIRRPDRIREDDFSFQVKLTTEMAQLDQQIQEHIEQQPDLQEKQALLISIPGIGLQTATHLLAEMPHLTAYPSAKQAAADAGLTPAERSPGTSVRQKPRLSKIANPRVRKILYFPALAAIRYNPISKAQLAIALR